MTQDQDHDNRDGVLSFSEILKMSRDEAAGIVGSRAWDIAHLQNLIAEVVASTPPPPAPPVPPTVFISYRWESDEHKAWVARLASDIREQGYDVFLDQHVQSGRDEPLPVPELLRRIARCNLFLLVLSRGYMERIEAGPERGSIRDGWVWDEVQAALQLQRIGRMLPLLVVWRSGELPDWIREDQVWDLRDGSQYGTMLEQRFPRRFVRIIGIRPDGTEEAVGPFERRELIAVGTRMQATGEFRHFRIEDRDDW